MSEPIDQSAENGGRPEIDYTDRQRAALGAAPWVCRALNPEGTFMCELIEGHEGDHEGFELPTIEIAEGEPW